MPQPAKGRHFPDVAFVLRGLCYRPNLQGGSWLGYFIDASLAALMDKLCSWKLRGNPAINRMRHLSPLLSHVLKASLEVISRALTHRQRVGADVARQRVWKEEIIIGNGVKMAQYESGKRKENPDPKMKRRMQVDYCSANSEGLAASFRK